MRSWLIAPVVIAGCGNWNVKTYVYETGAEPETESSGGSVGGGDDGGAYPDPDPYPDPEGDGDECGTCCEGGFYPCGGYPDLLPSCDPGTQNCSDPEEKCTAYLITPG
jgi:hypothetical protein